MKVILTYHDIQIEQNICFVDVQDNCFYTREKIISVVYKSLKDMLPELALKESEVDAKFILSNAWYNFTQKITN